MTENSNSIKQENWPNKSYEDKSIFRRIAFITSSATTNESSTTSKPINNTFDIDEAYMTRSKYNFNDTFDLEDSDKNPRKFDNLLVP